MVQYKMLFGEMKMESNANTSSKAYKEIPYILGIWIVAFLFILHFSSSTTLFKPDCFGFDSAFFQSIGKLWLEGIIPYRDFFDHKGPLLFMINALGYVFPNTRLGLFLVQSAFFSISLTLAYLTLRQFINPKYSVVILLVMILYLGMVFGEGNLSEEYSLTFVFCMLLFQAKWLKNQKKAMVEKSAISHPKIYSFIYGFCVMTIALIRINNALIPCIGILCIVWFLARQKQWKMILQNALFVIFGALVVFVPVAGYFYMNNAFVSFINGTFLFNLSYSRVHASLPTITNSTLFYSTPVLLSWFIGLYLLFKKELYKSVFLFVTGALTAYMCLGGNSYAHYFINAAPLIPIAFCLFMSSSENINLNSKLNKFIQYSVVLTLIVVFVYNINLRAEIIPYNPSVIEAGYANIQDSHWRNIIDQIPEDDISDVAVYNLSNDACPIFILTDLKPIYPNSVLTEWHAEVDPSIITKYVEFLKSDKPKWILCEDVENEKVVSLLDSSYELTYSYDYEDSRILLYRIKD